jgi:hypothetical protein
MIDLDKYCVECGSDQYTHEKQWNTDLGETRLWCDVCWDERKPIPASLRRYINELERAPLEDEYECACASGYRCERHS